MGSEWILGRLSWGCGLGSTVSGQGPVAGCCECGDESSGSCATELVSSCVFLNVSSGCTPKKLVYRCFQQYEYKYTRKDIAARHSFLS
jgi:hypothetical protein